MTTRQARVVIALLAALLGMGGVLAAVTYASATRNYCWTEPNGPMPSGHYGVWSLTRTVCTN